MLHARGNASLSAAPRPAAEGAALSPAAQAVDAYILQAAFADVVKNYCDPAAPTFIPALGMGYAGFRALLQRRLPHYAAAPGWLAVQQAPLGSDGALAEFPELLELLLAHCAVNDIAHRDVAHLVAAACMGNNHLWQDLGLPSRQALSALLSSHFPALAAKNSGDMKWKKFFYRQLCEQAGFTACNRPSCAGCCDYDACFGPEE